MNEIVIRQLVNINNEFYQSFGAAFAETRRRLQPGVERIIDTHINSGNWLDIGCGSGVLGQRLARSGMQGSYLGLDFSLPLLEEACRGADALNPYPGFKLTYHEANLFDEDWPIVTNGQYFDGILAFAALHHLPGKKLRERLIHQIHNLLKPAGLFIHSEWQFQNSPKLMARVQDWSLVGLSQADVEDGDTLLDWRHQHAGSVSSQAGLRYVHLFSKRELADLIGSAGFTLVEEFSSDGASGNLGLYQVWKKEH